MSQSSTNWSKGWRKNAYQHRVKVGAFELRGFVPFPTLKRPLLAGEHRQVYRELELFSSHRYWDEAPFSVGRSAKRRLVAWFCYLLISV